MNKQTDFQKFIQSHTGYNSSKVNDIINHQNKIIRNDLNYVNPSIIEERNLNVAVMDVFSRLMMDRIIFLGSEIDDYTANVVQAQLLYLDSNNPNDDISIYINSPGGSVYAGLGIYDTMQYIHADVSTICTGMAASMASIILCAGEAGKRFALPHSRVMIHQPMMGLGYCQASEIEISLKEINALKSDLYDIIAKHSGQDKAKITQDADRDYWMTSTQALDYGMIDEVLHKN